MLRTELLTPATWGPFAALVEAHGGVFGGCWCLGFHAERNKVGGYASRREAKRAKVRAGEAHAALVMAGETCLGWAQYGRQRKLPTIKNRKEYEATGAGGRIGA